MGTILTVYLCMSNYFFTLLSRKLLLKGKLFSSTYVCTNCSSTEIWFILFYNIIN